jgi:hypothetical protein
MNHFLQNCCENIIYLFHVDQNLSHFKKCTAKMKATQKILLQTPRVWGLKCLTEVLIRTRVINLRRNQISKFSNSLKEMTEQKRIQLSFTHQTV